MAENDIPPTPNSVADLPEWARTELTSVRTEAAQRRVELRAAEADKATAVTQVAALTEAKTTAETALATTQADLLRLRVTLAAGVPGDKAAEFAARLRGDTEAELTADAKSAIALFGAAVSSTPATDPSQGHGHDAPVATTPHEAFAAMIRDQVEGLKR